MSLLVTVMPGDVLEEYEGVVREAGYEPGSVLPSTLAAAAGLSSGGAALMVNYTHASVTTAVTNGDEMLLHRTMDLPADEKAHEEEMAQAVITALAWYEDTLKATPEKLHYAGPGGAQQVQALGLAAVCGSGAAAGGSGAAGGRIDDDERAGGNDRRRDGGADPGMKITVNLATRPFVELGSIYNRLRTWMAILAVLGLALWFMYRSERVQAEGKMAYVAGARRTTCSNWNSSRRAIRR